MSDIEVNRFVGQLKPGVNVIRHNLGTTGPIVMAYRGLEQVPAFTIVVDKNTVRVHAGLFVVGEGWVDREADQVLIVG